MHGRFVRQYRYPRLCPASGKKPQARGLSVTGWPLHMPRPMSLPPVSSEAASRRLTFVTHPVFIELADLPDKASGMVRDGCTEAAQVLIANDLETTMKNHANAWIRRTFPSAEYRGGVLGTGRHRILASATSRPDVPRHLTLLQEPLSYRLARLRIERGS
ncbi:hypothetical protein BX283_0470 [Streptomyces sp. TLI_146]|nr:hypothetical protein BX283_0470 [Streptomyces sp. TLI_146]